MSASFNVYRLELPIPIKALKTINAYLIESGDELVIIDTGMPVDFTVKALEEKTLEAGKQLKQISKIFVTHMHIDHIGNAGYIQELSDATIYMNKDEYKFAEFFILNPEESLVELKRVLRENGAPLALVEKIFEYHPAFSRQNAYRLIEKLEPLKDGENIPVGETVLVAIETPGHSPHHTCFYAENEDVLFTGDHILPTITPNVRFPILDENPLKEYIDSLEKVEKLKVREYYPAHGKPSNNLKERIKELKCHHYYRLLETFNIVSQGPITGYKVASKLTWDIKLDWERFPLIQKFFATGEALSHIRYLEYINVIDETKTNGVIHYKATDTVLNVKEKLKFLCENNKKEETNKLHHAQ